MVIKHNMSSLNTNRQLGITGKNKATAMERLSSGYRVNRAADDAAGLSISEEMRGQIRGLEQGAVNSADGISLVTVADAGMQEIDNILHRMRELTVQAANDTNVTADREAIQMEIDALCDEVDNIGERTEFNTIKVLQSDEYIIDGEGKDATAEKNPDPTPLYIQDGANTNDIFGLQMPCINSAVLQLNRIDVSTAKIASQSIEYVLEAVEQVNEARSRMGAYANRMEHAYANDLNSAENLQDSESKIRDADMADEMVNFSAASILEQAGQSMLVQANSQVEGIVGLLQ